MKKYFWNVLIWIDKGVNVIFAPLLNWAMKPVYKFGDHRDTLSEVFGRNKDTCEFCLRVCKFLSIFDKRHCEKNIED